MLVEPPPHAVGATGVPDRRQVAFTAAAPAHGRHREVVAVIPKPMIEPVATGATTLVCRHGSRALGLEMWTSTFGPSNAASASWIAQA